MFGTYTFKDDKSDKFWRCIPSPKRPGYFYTEWGPNGVGPIGNKDGLTQEEAEKKIREKISKGYRCAEIFKVRKSPDWRAGSGEKFKREYEAKFDPGPMRGKPLGKPVFDDTADALKYATDKLHNRVTLRPEEKEFWKEFYAKKEKEEIEMSVRKPIAESAPIVEIVHPSRCTSTLPEDLEKPYLIAEPKLDGSRYVLYIGTDPYGRHTGNTLLSRRTSTVDGKLVDRTLNVPHITTSCQYPGLEGTVIDGEIQHDDFPSTNSIMNSSPALAIQKQKELGNLKYHVWDIMKYQGKDIRHLPLEQRRKVLETVVEVMGNEYILPVPQVREDLQGYFNKIVGAGGEGIVVKDLRQAYGCGWSKYKKAYDVSCVITGWKPGNGKYKDAIGSLAISVRFKGGWYEVGFASGFDDKIRMELTKNFEKYKGKVIDVFAQEISKPSADHEQGRLRHPTFHRFRDDLNPEDCTLLKLRADLKTKIAKSRSKEDE